MKFLYKIWSGYDGFTPAAIPGRLQEKTLVLNWKHYIDSVEEGHEVWVYFFGPRVRPAGVYVKGFVQSIDTAGRAVHLRVRESSTDRPLTDAPTSERIAGIVKARGLQVFVYPDAWDTPPACNIALSALTCQARQCASCPTWKRLPLIDKGAHARPRRFPDEATGFSPAYWVIPSRCYIHQEGNALTPEVHRTSELFYRFKSGEANLAYPLALGIYNALRKRRLLRVDAIVPIPLSPDKVAAKEIHRTRLLARELELLLDVPVEEVLELSQPISKRRLRTQQGMTAKDYERLYYETLTLRTGPSALFKRLLLLDDVSTEGSTVRAAVRRLREQNRDAEIIVATAGQMLLKHVVLNKKGVVRN